MPFSVLPLLGIETNDIYRPAQYAQPPHLLGTETFTNNGRLAVFGQASAAIPANTSACTVNPTNFFVTASGGSYLSPSTALVTGEWAWFTRASV